MVAIDSPSQLADARPDQPSRIQLTDTFRFDMIVVALSLWFVSGLFIDGWAHNHGKVDESFFTVWHAMFYSGFTLVAGFHVLTLFRAVMFDNKSWQQALPRGYHLSLLGIIIFSLGGMSDLIWHTLYGIEEDIEALLSPTHLLLGLGIILIVSGPFRAALWRDQSDDGWLAKLPMILSLTLLLSVFTFFTQYVNPFLFPVGIEEETQPTFINGEIFVMQADGRLQTRLTTDPDASQFHPAWSADGQRIAFVSNAEDDDEIFVMNADGSGITRLTDNDVNDFSPSWSPDGTQLAFVSIVDDNTGNVFVMNADGSNRVNISHSMGLDDRPAWSPDGSRIAFSSQRDENPAIYVMNADGSDQQRVTETDAINWGPAWSPDGTRIAFYSFRDDNGEIYLMNADGTAQQRLTQHEAFDGFPVWSADGEQVIFMSRRDGDEEIYAVNIADGTLTNLSNNPGGQEGFPALSPDGQSIVYRWRPNVPTVFLTTELQRIGGLSTIFLTTAMMMGAVMLALYLGRLPFGALTLMFTANAALMSTQDDLYWGIAIAFIAGLVADVLLQRIDVSLSQPGMLRVFMFVVPVMYFMLYFAGVEITEGIGWSPDLWAGSIVLAGFVGFLVSFIAKPRGLKVAQ